MVSAPEKMNIIQVMSRVKVPQTGDENIPEGTKFSVPDESPVSVTVQSTDKVINPEPSYADTIVKMGETSRVKPSNIALASIVLMAMIAGVNHTTPPRLVAI
ncbi:hypothetical protein CYJ33_03485 [Alloscardovia omnicolens]|nr:hypothetical protein CYJ33_03485 [Alloscardovia omnicolens]